MEQHRLQQHTKLGVSANIHRRDTPIHRLQDNGTAPYRGAPLFRATEHKVYVAAILFIFESSPAMHGEMQMVEKNRVAPSSDHDATARIAPFNNTLVILEDCLSRLLCSPALSITLTLSLTHFVVVVVVFNLAAYVALGNHHTHTHANVATACTEKLVQNDPGLVELSLERLGDDYSLDDFADAMRVNRTVQHVCFSGTFVRELTPEQWRFLLLGVGHLETLQELQIWGSTVPVDAFAALLRNAQRLRKVYLFQVRLAGAPNEFVQWSASIRAHPALTEFRLGGIQTVDGSRRSSNSEQGISMDCVVHALAETINLKVVSLQLTQSRGVAAVPFTSGALAHLLRSTSVTDLHLTRLGLGPEHFGVIAAAIASNPKLRVLDLFDNNNSLTNENVLLLATALQQNTGLATFVLPCPQEEDLSAECTLAIARALRVNTTLVTLNLPHGTLSDDGLQHLAHGLTVNTTLKKMEVGGGHHACAPASLGDNKGPAAVLTEMLERNYGLERLVVNSNDSSIQETVEYYLRLNATGRGALLRNGHANNREVWVDMLISVRDDLDCLFYFITMNPTVCQAYTNSSIQQLQ